MASSCSKKLLPLLIELKWKNNGDFYCFNCLYFFRAKNKLELLKNALENKYFCTMIITSEDTKIIEFNQYQKSDKASFIIHADLEFIIEKIDGRKNIPNNSSTAKVRKQIQSSLSVSAIL